jgi:hypothetical protein
MKERLTVLWRSTGIKSRLTSSPSSILVIGKLREHWGDIKPERESRIEKVSSSPENNILKGFLTLAKFPMVVLQYIMVFKKYLTKAP